MLFLKSILPTAIIKEKKSPEIGWVAYKAISRHFLRTGKNVKKSSSDTNNEFTD